MTSGELARIEHDDPFPRDRDRSPEPAVSCLAPTPMVLSPSVWPLTASSVDRAKLRPSRAPDSSPGGRRGSTARPLVGATQERTGKPAAARRHGRAAPAPGRPAPNPHPAPAQEPGDPASSPDHEAAPGQSSTPPIARHALPAPEPLEIALSSSAATPKTEAGPQAFPSPSGRRAGAPVDSPGFRRGCERRRAADRVGIVRPSDLGFPPRRIGEPPAGPGNGDGRG
jgi:hypothetical protein